jgi:hypothetical protein
MGRNICADIRGFTRARGDVSLEYSVFTEYGFTRDETNSTTKDKERRWKEGCGCCCILKKGRVISFFSVGWE